MPCRLDSGGANGLFIELFTTSIAYMGWDRGTYKKYCDNNGGTGDMQYAHSPNVRIRGGEGEVEEVADEW